MIQRIDLINFIQGNIPINEIINQLIANFYDIFFFTLAIAVYGIIVWTFYQQISKRDLFESRITKYRKQLSEGQKFMKFILRFVEYGLIFPVFTFIWFMLLSVMLFLLAKSQPIENVLLISIGVISAARIASYYNEKLAEDLGKLLPLALLGVFLVDPSFFSMQLFWDRINLLISIIPKTLAFVLYLILLEWVLRVLLFFKTILFGDKKLEPIKT